MWTVTARIATISRAGMMPARNRTPIDVEETRPVEDQGIEGGKIGPTTEEAAVMAPAEPRG